MTTGKLRRDSGGADSTISWAKWNPPTNPARRLSDWCPLFQESRAAGRKDQYADRGNPTSRDAQRDVHPARLLT